jgi:hypothetical protein
LTLQLPRNIFRGYVVVSSFDFDLNLNLMPSVNFTI